MKSKPSKLDQYAETLLAMDDAKKTLLEIQAWLKEEGVTASMGRISEFLSSARQSRLQAALLSQIATGAEQCKEVEKQFGKNPAPELETLIKLHRVLILQLSTQGNANPEFLKLADQLMRTAMEFVSGQTKANHKERELRLAEEKFQIEFCEKILDDALRKKADEINASSLSQADKIAAMRQATFADVDALQASGKLKLPKA
jgi:DNA-binding phage protein